MGPRFRAIRLLIPLGPDCNGCMPATGYSTIEHQEDPQEDPKDWQLHVTPGCFFVRFVPEHDQTLFGEVLARGEGKTGKFFRHVREHSREHPEGAHEDIHVSSIAMLLSKEQFEKARQLGWPGDQKGLLKIFHLPSN